MIINFIAATADLAAGIAAENVGWDQWASAWLSHDDSRWNTAASCFTYTVLNECADGTSFVEYRGAFNGFQDQRLIPEEWRSGHKVEVVSVHGTHGCFEGRSALRDYAEARDRAAEAAEAAARLAEREAAEAEDDAYIASVTPRASCAA